MNTELTWGGAMIKFTRVVSKSEKGVEDGTSTPSGSLTLNITQLILIHMI